MTTSQMDADQGRALPQLPEQAGAESLSLGGMAKQVEKLLKSQDIHVKPLSVAPALKDFLRLYTSRLPDPLDPGAGEVDFVIGVACGEWTSARVDDFIAAMAPQRVRKGLPLFHLYSSHAVPPEVAFLFETMLAGVFEIMAWEVLEEPSLDSQDCLDLAEAGRQLLGDLYSVNLAPDDLQWLSVVNQLVIEEFRWFNDDADAPADEGMDYVPHAALILLGCVAGEAVRLNHTHELVWADAEGLNLPRLGRLGTTVALPVLDTVLRRFEVGQSADLWESYELCFASGQLSPPVSLGGEVNPLDFLPNWDPEGDVALSDAVAEFKKRCEDASIELVPHPPCQDPALADHVVAFTCYHEDQCYDLFVSTGQWTEALTQAFVREYGHRSFEDWEIGQSPVFVFFSGHPLHDLLEYAFIQGPPIAPLEALARVETPVPNVPNDPNAPDMIALWFIHALELYTTIGLDLGSPSVIPGLEFFLREELHYEPDLLDEVEAQLEASSFEPLGILVAVGMTMGTSLVTRHPETYTWHHPEGADWPVLKDNDGQTRDMVAEARQIFEAGA